MLAVRRIHARGCVIGTIALLSVAAQGSLPPVQSPGANPPTEAKRVLGKMLFWDEQLSSDNRMSCGTCHKPASGGSTGGTRNAGFDGTLNTADDAFGASGVVRADASGSYRLDTLFPGVARVTPRNPPTVLGAAYANQVFWDGRGTGVFLDPITGQAFGSDPRLALEVLGLRPPVDAVEMAHEGRNWATIVTKLQSVRPLALAETLPADVEAILASNPTYSQLFQSAFGTPVITPSRVAMAMGTYQRTLVPDLTPWDSFVAGQQGALTPRQQQGLQAFGAVGCQSCHTQPLFTNQQFHNIGLRPPAEDPGRQAVTGAPFDRGRFKTPTLRNVGLRSVFMHNGSFSSLEDIVRFYGQAPGARQRFTENIDQRVLGIRVQESQIIAIADFLRHGLTDARAASESFPFDRPVLWSERVAQHAQNAGGGRVALDGTTPRMIASDPPMIGNADFRLGVRGLQPGEPALLVRSDRPPSPFGTLSPAIFVTSATAGSDGVATAFLPLTLGNAQPGETRFYQWIIAPANSQRFAASDAAAVTFFCPRGGCQTCRGDFDRNGFVESDDLAEFINCYFNDACAGADFDNSGERTADDLAEFINAFFGGC